MEHFKQSDAPETATGGVLWKTVFLKPSQNSQENTCVGNPNTGAFLWFLQNF